MRGLILGLIIGAAVGYKMGYQEGYDGKPSIVTRTLDRFGTSKVKAAQEARERRVLDAAKP
jgi:hypothetical protein